MYIGYLSFAAAGFLLLGCRHGADSTVEAIEGGAIAFETTSLSKSTPITNAADMSTMGVFCSSTGFDNWSAATSTPNKMFDVQMTNSAGKWTYPSGGESYWESGMGGRFTFFAYAPYGTDASGNGITLKTTPATPGAPVLSYSAPADVTVRPDLMIAVPKIDLHPVPTVPLSMKHALTAITFSVRLPEAPGGDEIKLKSIALTNVQYEGSVSLNVSGGVVWNFIQTKERSEVITTSDLLNDGVLTATTPVSVMKDATSALFVLPQPMSKAAPVGLQLVYTVNGEEYTPDPFSLAALAAWEPGKQVEYLLTYVPGTRSFTLDATNVTPWGTQAVGADVNASYLSVSEIELVSAVGETVRLYCGTDAPWASVTASASPAGLTLIKGSGSSNGGYFDISGPVGVYTVTIKAGLIERTVLVKRN